MTAVVHVATILILPVFSYDYPFRNPELPLQRRVNDLVNRLSVEEIINQTFISNIEGKHEQSTVPAIPRLGVNPFVWKTDCTRGIAHTNATSFPQDIGLAASFSTDLVYRVAEAISVEARAHQNYAQRKGIFRLYNGTVCLGPNINIMRHPLWGRNSETYGEDPFLTSQIVSAHIRGLQGNHSRYKRALDVCKHFDAHSGPENIPQSRFSFNANVTQRDLRMTYLRHFKTCVDEGALGLMCSYNRINGTPSCANSWLMNEVVRNEWGFKGFFISDAGAIMNQVTAHKTSPNCTVAASRSILAGCNLELGNPACYTHQIDALQEGFLSKDDILLNVKPLLYTRMHMGEFDPPEMNPYNKINMSSVLTPEHLKLAIEAAQKSFILLKNRNNILPLTTFYDTVAIVGPVANNTSELFGWPSSPLNKFTKSPWDSLRHLAGKKSILAQGCDSNRCKNYNRTAVKTAASKADLVIVCLGTGLTIEAEDSDRSDLALPGFQLDLLQDAAEYANGAPVILLLFTGGPVDLTWAKLSDEVSAIMQCFYPAQGTGDALVNVLTHNGRASTVPAGRSPYTWPAYLHQVPDMIDYNMEHGATYRYLKTEPLYPFGYGLSYTTFEYSHLRIENVQNVANVFKLSVDVKNTGEIDADEVIQVYIRWRNASVPVPRVQLSQFQRQTISAGKSITINFLLTSETFKVWGNDTGFIVEAGTVDIYVGGEQPNQRTTSGANHLHTTITTTTQKLHS